MVNVIRLRAKDRDGKPVLAAIQLASGEGAPDPQEVMAQIDTHVELKAAEAVAPVQAQLTAAQGEAKAMRDIVVGETVRLRKLASGEDFDAEAETAYLEGLPAERLKMEFDRAAAADPTVRVVATRGAESGEDPKKSYAETVDA